jgi:cytochrome c-type biogenesis protein
MAARNTAENPSPTTIIGSIRTMLGGRRWVALTAALVGVVATSLVAGWWLTTAPAVGSVGAVRSSVGEQELTRSLTRLGTRPEGTFPSVDVMLITPEFARVGGNREVVGSIAEPSLVFYVYEETHVELPVAPPRPLLRLAGAGLDAAPQAPVEVRVVADSPHHRTVVVRYALGGSLAHLQHGMGERLELIFPAPVGFTGTGNILAWDLPIRYGREIQAASPILSADSLAGPTSTAGGFGLSPALALGLFGGLLASTWPCLVQLVAYFIPTVAGLSLEQGGRPTPAMRRKVAATAVSFVAGIVVVYTAAGALIGYLAATFGGAELLTANRQPLGIVAGIVIIALALRMAVRARAPLVCRLPIVSHSGHGEAGPLATAALGLAIGTGCMTCFGATLTLAMVTYTATTGSALTGAVLMFVFSVGIAIPLVAAAVAMGRVLPLLGRLQAIAPWMALASSVVMIGFALLLITDTYHVVSGALAAAVQ